MGTKSRGRGAVATLGLLVLLGGILAAAVLFVLSGRQHDEIVESFARAPAGCTTTLDFAETGVFYVYVEVGGDAAEPTDQCTPVASGGEQLVFVIAGDTGPLTTRRDRSISYDVGEFAGSSHSRFEVAEPGTYSIVVASDDDATVAAIGRDPVDARSSLRRWALAVGLLGLLGGGALLTVSGRRSRRATNQRASMVEVSGDGQSAARPQWPPTPPAVPQHPINPHQPDAFSPPFANQVIEDGADDRPQPPAPAVRSEPWAPPPFVSRRGGADDGPLEAPHDGDESAID